MATIGLDKLYYAKITENSSGEETYGTPQILAKAIQADLEVELAEATLYADDAISEVVKEFKSGTLTLGVDDLGQTVLEDLTGASVDANGVIVSASEDGGDPVAIGFRARKANGKYRYFWLYRVKFAIPSTNLATKGDSITFQTPSIEGTIMCRNRTDSQGNHPWKVEVTEGDSSVQPSTISGWYTQVYEPTFTAADVDLQTLALGNLTLTPEFSANVTSYTAATSNATNTVTATAHDSEAAVAITVNGTSIASGSAATWEDGLNTVRIVVTNGTATKTYTVTVTKS